MPQKFRIAIIWSTGTSAFSSYRGKLADAIQHARWICAHAPRHRTVVVATVTPPGGEPVVARIDRRFGVQITAALREERRL